MSYKKQSTLIIKMTHDLDIPNKMKYIIQSRKKHGVLRNVRYYVTNVRYYDTNVRRLVQRKKHNSWYLLNS